MTQLLTFLRAFRQVLLFDLARFWPLILLWSLGCYWPYRALADRMLAEESSWLGPTGAVRVLGLLLVAGVFFSGPATQTAWWRGRPIGPLALVAAKLTVLFPPMIALPLFLELQLIEDLGFDRTTALEQAPWLALTLLASTLLIASLAALFPKIGPFIMALLVVATGMATLRTIPFSSAGGIYGVSPITELVIVSVVLLPTLLLAYRRPRSTRPPAYATGAIVGLYLLTGCHAYLHPLEGQSYPEPGDLGAFEEATMVAPEPSPHHPTPEPEPRAFDFRHLNVHFMVPRSLEASAEVLRFEEATLTFNGEPPLKADFTERPGRVPAPAPEDGVSKIERIPIRLMAIPEVDYARLRHRRGRLSIHGRVGVIAKVAELPVEVGTSLQLGHQLTRIQRLEKTADTIRYRVTSYHLRQATRQSQKASLRISTDSWRGWQSNPNGWKSSGGAHFDHPFKKLRTDLSILQPASYLWIESSGGLEMTRDPDIEEATPIPTSFDLLETTQSRSRAFEFMLEDFTLNDLAAEPETLTRHSRLWVPIAQQTVGANS